MVIDIEPATVVVLLGVAGLGAVTFSIARGAPEMLTRLVVGLVLGLALAPLVAAVQRRLRIGRGAAAALVGGGLTVAFAAVVLLVAPPAVRQARSFGVELPTTVRQLYDVPILGARLRTADAAGRASQLLSDLPGRLNDRVLAELGERLLGGALSGVVVLVTALGVLVDGERLVQRGRRLVPISRRDEADRVGRIVYATFGSYFAGSLVVAVLNGLVVLTAGLILGIPLAPIAGLWCMLTNLIPQIGGALGGSVFVVLAFTRGPVHGLIALALFVAYGNLENNVIAPAIVGRAVDLSPPATMLAALIGAAAAGVPGALVATPLLGAAKAIYLERRGLLDPTEPARVRSSFFGRVRAGLVRRVHRARR